MRADDGRHAPVEMPAHRDLFRSRLGMHVEEYVIYAIQLSERHLDLGECRTSRPQV